MTLKQALNPPPNYVNSRLHTGSRHVRLAPGPHTHTGQGVVSTFTPGHNPPHVTFRPPDCTTLHHTGRGSHYDPDALEALHTTTALLALTLSPNQLSYINSSDLPQPITTFLPSNNQSPVFLLTCSLYNQSDTPYHPALGSHLS
ncbi:hypothetical protein Pcinc_007359 [Petrolisthes cinctipes]|uniref:Uncharacterized protein n=1 Tax=Petrolisthes cinctipes TaxID=88211 RepID=A0AAE1GBC2_PETCI|nr:hypothetical protein Pcinc_007359 [Petrolisthes cinctipes]